MRRERLALGSRLLLLVALASFIAAAGRPSMGAGAAASVRLSGCTPEGYGLEQGFASQTATRPDSVRLTVGWLAAMEGRRSCRLSTTIQMTIKGFGAAAVNDQWNVRAVLKPWSSVERTWVWRNWCASAREGGVTVEFSDPTGRRVRQLVPRPPTCARAGTASTVTVLGTGRKYVRRPGDRIRPHILRKGIPPPLHQALIKVRNTWLVSDGYTLVAVYAGTAGNNPTVGRFAIIRQNAIFGVQYEPPDLVDVRKARGLKITRGPRGASRETTAQRARLAFVSANGTKGFLDLNADRVRVTSRR